MVAPTPPAYPTYPVEAIGKLLNLTSRRIQQLVREGVIPRAEHGKYDLIRTIRGYVKYLQERAEGRAVESKDMHAERTRLFREQADAMALKNSLQRREIVPVEQISVTLAKVASAVVTILESIPIRLKRANPALTQSDLDIVRAEIVKARNECADILP